MPEILEDLISMFLISPKLSLFVVIFIPLCGFVISIVGKSLRRKSLKVQKEQGQFISLVDETLSGMKILKIFNDECFIISDKNGYKIIKKK